MTEESAQPSTDQTKSKAVSSTAFSLLAGYAAAVTLALIWLLMNSSAHQLESLPDIQPLGLNGFQHVPAIADLPAGHSLRIGQQQRFGDVLVRPIRIERGLLHFEHSRSATTARDPEGPVLKLWLEIENLSDADLSPYDLALMTHRHYGDGAPPTTLTNSFLFRSDDRKRTETVLNFDHPATSDWNLRGHPTEAVAPGATITTFVASEADNYSTLLADAGTLVWRIQIRKGIGPGGHGVTTLVDFVFDHDEIQDETG